MRMPALIDVRSVIESSKEVSRQISTGEWVPARGIPFYPGLLFRLWYRLKYAWLVFAGKCDALIWPEQ